MAGESIFDRLDPDQRAAVALRRNGTVSAGAGSGKTTVLAARYLDLIRSEGADPGSILCLTFTQKAAAEMEARVYKELSASTEPRARAAMERFAEASISTIDSFCSSVLRSSAQDYGYAPDFAVDDEAIRDLAETQALSFLLERREEPELRELFARMGFETAWRELFAEAAYRYVRPCERPESEFRAMPERARKALEAARRRALGLLDEARRLFAESARPRTARAKAWEAILEALPQALEELGAAAETALRPIAEGALTGFGRDEDEKLLKEAAGQARSAAQRILSLDRAERELPLQAAVLGRLAEFAEAYREAKRRAGLMGFRDVATAAVDLLSRRPELRAYWKRRFRYIMVDEFQDDDELQKELLYLLAERPELQSLGVPAPEDLAPDKLFFVGDDKQSIYRFRGADVSVFNRLSRELGAGNPAAPLEPPAAAPGAPEAFPKLRTNYRSEPGLVDFFNAVFARVLAGPLAEDYEAKHEEALSRPPCPGQEPSARLLFMSKEDKELSRAQDSVRSADEALAEALARFLEEEVGSGRLLVPGPEGPRPARYEDCAILQRSSSKQFYLERFLRLHDIPYTAVSVRGLFLESPANDLYAALRLCLLPEDRPAYAALLRSPLAGLSDEGLVLILDSELPAFDPRAEALLDRADLAAFRRGAELLRALTDKRDRVPLSELVSLVWFEGGLRLKLLRRPELHPYLEQYDFLFSLAARSDVAGEGLADFLARLEPLMGQPEGYEDKNTPRELGGGVKIMTVHASKGLEFPVVIIPWLENKGRKDGAGSAFYLSKDAGISLNLRDYRDPKGARSNIFYEEAKELEQAKERAEVRRLFYVALTRASCHLVFAALEPGSADDSGDSFLSLLTGQGGKPVPDLGFPDLHPMVRIEPIPPLSQETYSRLARRRSRPDLAALSQAYESAARIDRRPLPRKLSATALEAQAVLLAESGAKAELPEGPAPGRLLPASAYDDAADRVSESVFGELCHAVIEEALGGRPLGMEALAPIPVELRDGLAAEAKRMAELFLASPIGKRASAAPRRELEKTILLSLGPFVIHCRLDFYAEDAEGILVLDWKSGREARPGAYAAQLGLYRLAAQALSPGQAVKAALVWLRSGEAEECAEAYGPSELLALAEYAALAAAAGGAGPEDNNETEDGAA